MAINRTAPAPTERKPIVWFDGDCAFCRHQVDRLLYLCGWRADASPLQSSLRPGETVEEMKLQMPDGELFGGAEAVFRTLALSPLFRPLLWLYLIPGIRQILNFGYRVVAQNRYNMAISACSTGSCGVHRSHSGLDQPPALGDGRLRPTYRRSAKLFLTLFCLLYAVTFIGMYVQVLPLNGSNGLLPSADFLERLRPESESPPATDWRDHHVAKAPTLFWLDVSDRALSAGCLIGAAAAVLGMLGVFRRTMLLILGTLYLSYVSVGGAFYNFQWDGLQLEVTLLALLLPAYAAPLIFRGSERRFAMRFRAPHPVVVFLMLWLLFRLYFESGLAKILTVNGGWRDLSAMQYYYDTAPLATWLGWKAHNLPAWWHQIESALVLLIELVLPIFIFSRRCARGVLFVVFTAFQVAILLTANYGQFNYLTLLLGLFLLDDAHYQPLLQLGRRMRSAISKRNAEAIATRYKDQVYVPSITGWVTKSALLFVIAVAIVSASLVEMSMMFLDKPTKTRMMAWAGLAPSQVGNAAPQVDANNWFVSGLAHGYFVCKRARLVNRYHLFAHMTRTRDVPVFEGLGDDGEWKAYPYRWAPSNPNQRPSIIAPYHPRFDFQIWFRSAQRGLARLLVAKLREDPSLAGDYFASDPFEGSQPSKLRVRRFRYRMSDPGTFDQHGWWVREPTGVLVPPIDVPVKETQHQPGEAGDSSPSEFANKPPNENATSNGVKSSPEPDHD